MPAPSAQQKSDKAPSLFQRRARLSRSGARPQCHCRPARGCPRASLPRTASPSFPVPGPGWQCPRSCPRRSLHIARAEKYRSSRCCSRTLRVPFWQRRLKRRCQDGQPFHGSCRRLFVHSRECHHAIVEIENPSECLLRRRDIVAFRAEHDDWRTDVTKVDDCSIRCLDATGRQIVADKQLINDELNFFCV